MRVTVLGGGGRVGGRVVRLLAADGHDAVALVRREEQAVAVRTAGARAVVGDLTADFAAVLDGADAVVFTAGAGGGAPPERTDEVDHRAAVRTAHEAARHGARRFVQVSSLFADRPEQGPPFLRHYLEAKGRADEALLDADLDWTIVRPGGLTDEPGTGRVTVTPHGGAIGMVSRDDVAAVVVGCLVEPATIGRAFDLVAGVTPVAAALAELRFTTPA